MANNKKKGINKLWVGFLSGLILPFLVFIVLYYVREVEIPFFDYVSSLWQLNVIFLMLQLCVLPNLAIFLYFAYKKYDMASRGVLLATFVYAFVIVFSSVL